MLTREWRSRALQLGLEIAWIRQAWRFRRAAFRRLEAVHSCRGSSARRTANHGSSRPRIGNDTSKWARLNEPPPLPPVALAVLRYEAVERKRKRSPRNRRTIPRRGRASVADHPCSMSCKAHANRLLFSVERYLAAFERIESNFGTSKPGPLITRRLSVGPPLPRCVAADIRDDAKPLSSSTRPHAVAAASTGDLGHHIAPVRRFAHAPVGHIRIARIGHHPIRKSFCALLSLCRPWCPEAHLGERPANAAEGPKRGSPRMSTQAS